MTIRNADTAAPDEHGGSGTPEFTAEDRQLMAELIEGDLEAEIMRRIDEAEQNDRRQDKAAWKRLQGMAWDGKRVIYRENPK